MSQTQPEKHVPYPESAPDIGHLFIKETGRQPVAERIDSYQRLAVMLGEELDSLYGSDELNTEDAESLRQLSQTLASASAVAVAVSESIFNQSGENDGRE